MSPQTAKVHMPINFGSLSAWRGYQEVTVRNIAERTLSVGHVAYIGYGTAGDDKTFMHATLYAPTGTGVVLMKVRQRTLGIVDGTQIPSGGVGRVVTEGPVSKVFVKGTAGVNVGLAAGTGSDGDVCVRDTGYTRAIFVLALESANNSYIKGYVLPWRA